MSSIRVNPYPMQDLLGALEELERQQNGNTLQLATGSRINRPSDDPAGAARLVEVSDQGSQVDSFQRSISSLNGLLSTADSTLSSVVTALQRAISLGVEGANGTLSDNDRADVAAELTGIQSQLVSLANATYQGQYIFAGTADTNPYVVDASNAAGVRYAGNLESNTVAIGSGYNIAVNLPGSQIFSAAGADMFLSIQDLITALKANSGIDTAMNEVSGAFRHVTAQRVFYGNAMNQVQMQQTNLGTETLNLTEQQNAIAGADMAKVASEVANNQIAMNATLNAIGLMPRTSLFDYLK